VLRLTSDDEIGVLGTGRLDKGFINLLRRIITKGPEKPASGKWPPLAARLDRDDNLCVTRECVTRLFIGLQSLKYTAFATPIPEVESMHAPWSHGLPRMLVKTERRSKVGCMVCSEPVSSDQGIRVDSDWMPRRPASARCSIKFQREKTRGFTPKDSVPIGKPRNYDRLW
jgi:hypothetical protein